MEIIEIRYKHMIDIDPDLSYLGKYSNEYEKWAISRIVEHDWSKGEYEYFIPTNPPQRLYREERVREWKNCMEAYKRMESINAGKICMLGIRAEAEITIQGIIQTIRSGGLWGIESDSDQQYFDQVHSEQLTELAEILQDMGFKRDEILKASENIETIED
jgi:hypothetical protein